MRIVKIGEVFKTSSGLTPLSTNDDFYKNGNINWLTSGEVSQYKISSTKNHITDFALQKTSLKIVPKNSVVVAMYGATVGEIGILNTPTTTNQAVCSIFPNNDNNSFYLYYQLLFQKNNLINLASGSARTNISQKIIKDFEINLPDLETQTKIASVLSALDDKIELNNRINAQLEQLARTLYDYWFVQFDFPNGEGKPYRASGGKMKFSPELNREIPEGWEVKKLGELLNIKTEASEPDKSKKCIDLSVMPNSNIAIQGFSAGDAFSSNMKKMEKYDILFGSIRPYLKKAGIAPFDGLRAGTVHAFTPKKKEFYNFCAITMTSEFFFEYAIGRSAGSTRMPSISSKNLMEYKVAINDEVIAKFQNTLPFFAKTISRNIIENQKLAELRDWLLPLLMSGQVQIKN